jgi:hypothetical protein
MRSRTFRAETPLEALVLEQALLPARQLRQAADAAPDGQVLARVEQAALPAGRELTRKAVEAALQAQADAAENEGRPAAAAPPEGTRPTKPGGGCEEPAPARSYRLWVLAGTRPGEGAVRR